MIPLRDLQFVMVSAARANLRTGTTLVAPAVDIDVREPKYRKKWYRGQPVPVQQNTARNYPPAGTNR